ncbi:Ig-like domain-containing protein [Pseudomonas viridiflava]|uniref:Ig-like domain-containing protein n=1 Tax=Pseudomonas viridiflava TaxID=33069 RepID=UPI000F0289E2|nr:Ig-like domain-containing protein [Pseudomonas viridiflava]
MLFDGAVAATVVEAAAQPDAQPTPDAAAKSAEQASSASNGEHSQPDATADVTVKPAAVPGSTVVFIDSRVKDSASLLAGVAPGAQVVELDATKDGLQQIADYLGSHQGVSSVQIIAHGNSGDLWLGNSYVSADNISQRSALLAEIGNDINTGGDILIYACNTAEGDQGLSFVDSLATLTGRDIAASTNRTGVGGDWDLEIATGSIESVSALSRQSMDAYQWGLATFTVNSASNTGTGTLRDALANAQNGDIVTFSTGMTVSLQTQLLVNKNITIDGDLNNDGVADVTIDGQNRTSVMRVTSGTTATLDGVIITRGVATTSGANSGSAIAAADALGGGINNAGNLTLRNVTITANAASGGGGGGGVLSPTVGGGGGGGGGIGGQNGATGGVAGTYTPTAPAANIGGNGAGFNTVYMGGKGGNASGGGAGGLGVSGYTNGGNGGTASSGGRTIGGGGGGSGYDATGGRGGSAVGGIYNAATGTIAIIGTSTVSSNIGAGGGGGGGGTLGGNGGRGIGGIWNKGTVNITASNNSAMTGNVGGSGAGGQALSGGTNGSSPTAVNNILNDGGTLNIAYTADTTAPTGSSIVIANTSLSPGATTTVTITFSEPVFGLDISEITAPNGTLTNLTTTNNITWTATFTAGSNTSGGSSAITLATSAVQDAAGNIGTGTLSSNNYAVVDNVPPTATVVVSDSALSVGETSLVTITFSEAVTGFTNADLTVTNGALTAVSSSDGGITWTATLTPTNNFTSSVNQITLDRTGVQDLAGNVGTGTTASNNYAIDTARPTATVVVADNALSIGETSLVTITFSEAVTGFTLADLSVSNGTLSALSSNNGGITWTATYTPTNNITSTTNVITLNNTGVTDLAGNTGSGLSVSNNYAIDTARPTAGITMADNALSVGETSLVTITFSEAISGFTNADLSVPNGTLSAVSSSDGRITWTATYTPNINVADTTNLITLNNAGVTDLAGNIGTGTTSSPNFTIDTLQPTATLVIADSALSIGETSLVTITFSEAVSGFTNADLTVANGTLSAVSSSDGGVTWTATLTPTASVTDTTNLITLDNTGFANASGNIGSGITASNNYAIDTQRPTATLVVADNALSIGETSLVTITFSEAVSGFSNADLSVSNGTLSAVSSSDGGITWTATYTPTNNITSTTNVITLNNTGVADAAGNTGAGTTSSNNYAIDTARPTAGITMADNALSVGETSLVTITFSEAVSGFTNADLSVPNGTLSAVSSSDGGITWTATYTPNINVADTTNLITLNNAGVTDLAGNLGTGTTSSPNFTIDTLQPTATLVIADSALSIGETSLVTITFSEAVTGFTNADLTVVNGNLSAVSSSDGGVTWTATLTPTASVTDATNLITLDNTGFANASGNIGSGITASNNYAIDTQRPTATLVVADNALSIGETSLVTITFSEAVSGFSNADLSVPSGTLSAVSSSDGGITWTATYTPTNNITSTTNLITLNNAGVTDLAGNLGTGTTSSPTFTIDTLQPTATIVIADSTLSIGETSLVTITFSEAVTGFTNADLSVSNGTLSAVSSSDGGITWTATLTPTAGITSTSNSVTLSDTGVTDLAGNTGSGLSVSNNYAIDTARPTATVALADTALSVGETSLVTITFSEAVSGFRNADLTVSNGTLSAVTSNDGGITWTATFTPNSNINDTTNLITLDTAGVADLAGNVGNETASSLNFTIDTLRPTSTVVVADNALSIGETSLVTITFSEAISDFTLSDMLTNNATLSGLSSSDGGITWTVTLTPAANITDTSNLVLVNNTRVVDLAGNAGSGLSSSNNYAVDTVRPTATITVANSNLAIGQTSLVTFAFSEPVSGFDLSDISVGNGTLSGLASADNGLTWTATLTANANTTAPNNFIVLDSGTVNDLAGNAGTAIALSSNYTVDTQRPSATLSLANPNLSTGQTSLVTFAFSEPVTNFTLSDISVANGTLSNLTSSNGGATWTATLTPTTNTNDPSNFIVLDSGTVTDLAGNAGTGTAVSSNYAITTLSQAGDPQFRVDAAAPLNAQPNIPLQPLVFGNPTGALAAPLSFAPLFEQRTTGGDLPPVGNIFINNRPLAPSFIAQVFTPGSVGGAGSGFLGFSSGEGSVFSSSTLSTLFARDTSTAGAFEGAGSRSLSDSSQSISAGFGALTLGQQLQQITDIEREKLRELAWALGEVGVSEAQA